jgi:hypothetical protein
VTLDGPCLVDTSCMATPTPDLSSQGSRRKQLARVSVIIGAIVRCSNLDKYGFETGTGVKKRF